MRSRYTAYTMVNMDYIRQTMRGHALVGFQLSEARSWAKRVHWIKLEVIQAELIDACTGAVEFEASFVDGSSLKSIHEQSVFKNEAGCWYYVDGTPLLTRHHEQRILRQTACPCGSSRKFKNCHGRTR